MKFRWKVSAGLAVLAMGLQAALKPTDDGNSEVALGVAVLALPLVVVWGIAWALISWINRPTAEVDRSEAALLASRQKRRDGVRNLFIAATIVGVGVLATYGQLHLANHKAAGPAIARLLVTWVLYGLFAYAIVRAVPRIHRSAPAVIAATVIAAGVNYYTYTGLSEERQARASLAKAAPLIKRIQAGTPVSDQEVREARIGILEPILLVKAAYTRDVNAIGATYTQEIEALHPPLMLAPATLVSPSLRAQTRAKLKKWQQLSSSYKSQVEAAGARGKHAIRAAEAQLPASMSGSGTKGFDQSAALLNSYAANLVASDAAAGAAISTLLDFMDIHPDRYALDNKASPARLLFSDEPTLARYRELMGRVVASFEQEKKAKERLLQTQAAQNARIDELIKP